jgi:hypothetical protein
MSRAGVAVGLATAIGVVAAVPVLLIGPGLALAPIAFDGWGIAWTSLVEGPNVARAAALDGLVTILNAAAACAAVVALLTILALSIARGVERRGEIVVRRAVGASRRALRRAAIAQGTVLAGAALIAGVAASAALMTRLRAAWPGSSGGFARLAAAPALVALALAAAVVLGALIPLVYARRRTPGTDATGRGVPLFVPAVQFGFGLLGVIGAAQLARAAGDDTAGMPAPTGRLFSVTALDSSARMRAVRYAAVLDTLHRDRRVALASLASPGTHVGLGTVDYITAECGHCFDGGLPAPWHVVRAANHIVSADTFQALGLRVVEGRGIADADRGGAAPVAVVSRWLAQHDFEGGQAIGRRVRVGPLEAWYTVVGVVDDGTFDGVGASAQPRRRVYLSALQHPARTLELLVRPADHAPDAFVESAGESEQAVRERETAAARWFATALRWEGRATMVIALLGLVAVLRLWLRGAIPEIALRRSVGARRVHVLGRVLARALLITAGGIAIAWWLEPLSTELLGRAVPGLPAGGLALVPESLLALAALALMMAVATAWRAARSAPAALPGFTDL